MDPTANLVHLVWLLPAAVGAFMVHALRDIARSVTELNTTLSVLVTRVDSHEDRIDDHEERIRVGEHARATGEAS